MLAIVRYTVIVWKRLLLLRSPHRFQIENIHTELSIKIYVWVLVHTYVYVYVYVFCRFVGIGQLFPIPNRNLPTRTHTYLHSRTHTYITLYLFVCTLYSCWIQSKCVTTKAKWRPLHTQVYAHGKGKTKMSTKVQVALNSIAICAPIYHKQTYICNDIQVQYIHTHEYVCVWYILSQSYYNKRCVGTKRLACWLAGSSSKIQWASCQWAHRSYERVTQIDWQKLPTC